MISLDFILTALIYTLILVLLHIFLLNIAQARILKKVRRELREHIQMPNAMELGSKKPSRSILKDERQIRARERVHVPSFETFDDSASQITQDYLRYFQVESDDFNEHAQDRYRQLNDDVSKSVDMIKSEKTELDAFYDKMMLDESFSQLNLSQSTLDINDVLPKRTSVPDTTSMSSLNSSVAFDNIMAFDEYEESTFGSNFSNPF